MPKFPLHWCLAILLAFTIASCTTYNHLSSIETERVTVSEETQANVDEQITAMIDPYKQQLDAKMDRVIGQLNITLKKSKPEGTLNNWMTDIIHERAEHYHGKPIDFAIQNYGGIRVREISAGSISVRKIYELMPFDNKIVILELDGKTMSLMLDNIASKGGMPVSKAIKMTIDTDQKPKDVLINGDPLDINRTYTMALPDYVANGGGGCDFLKPLTQVETGWNVREAIIDYLDTYKEEMSATIEGRITKQ